VFSVGELAEAVSVFPPLESVVNAPDSNLHKAIQLGSPEKSFDGLVLEELDFEELDLLLLDRLLELDFEELDRLDELEELNKLEELDEDDRLDELDKLEELDEEDRLDELDELDRLDEDE